MISSQREADLTACDHLLHLLGYVSVELQHCVSLSFAWPYTRNEWLSQIVIIAVLVL
jgi:hypothetical protein